MFCSKASNVSKVLMFRSGQTGPENGCFTDIRDSLHIVRRPVHRRGRSGQRHVTIERRLRGEQSSTWSRSRTSQVNEIRLKLKVS